MTVWVPMFFHQCAVPNTSVLAVKYGPVKVMRESTDLQYRRNDPEAYRRQARLGTGRQGIGQK